MRAVFPGFRIWIALLAALSVMIAVPLHASHNHGGDLGKLDGPCAICKSHTTACGPGRLVRVGSLLQPLGVLSCETRVAVVSTPATIVAPRAPPVSFA